MNPDVSSFFGVGNARCPNGEKGARDGVRSGFGEMRSSVLQDWARRFREQGYNLNHRLIGPVRQCRSTRNPECPTG